MTRCIDLTGKRFGKLIVLSRNEANSKDNKPLWLCLCDCGNLTITRGSNLKKGCTKSCGKCVSTIFEIDGEIVFGKCTNGVSFVFDLDNLNEISKHNWFLDSNGYIFANVNDTKVRIHRMVLNCTGETKCVDHINGNKLDNRKINLRECSVSENAMNKRRKVTSNSRYKGVTWHKKNNKWQAQIEINSKSKYIGQFDNELEAALAYDRMARELFGDFARVNFP